MSFVVQGLESIGQGIESFFGGFAGSISQSITSIFSYFAQVISGVIDGIRRLVGDISNFINRVADTLDNIGKAVVAGLSEAWNLIRTVFGDLVGFFKNLPKMIWTGLTELYNAIVTAYNAFRSFIGSALQEFINILSGFFGYIADVMLYPFSYIRYLFNYALYYLITHAENLIGGFLFGTALYELKSMKYTSLSDFMGKMFATGLKYYLIDQAIMGLITLYRQKSRIKKPVPPAVPVFGGVKL